jgi:uncharacterized membrane protein
MHEVLTDVTNLFHPAGEAVVLVLEIISVICIVIGIAVSVMQIIKRKTGKAETTPLYINVRIKFGGWLALALEYQLAADIVGTTIAPTYEHLIRLGAIALIRTFLNYFLNREVKEEVETRKLLIKSGMAEINS